MKTRIIALGALVGGLLVVPMVALMYLADQWLNLSFAPYDVFDWIARILPGPLVTFGIDLMIDSLNLIGLNVADTAKTAEHIQAILLFGVGGVVASVILHFIVARRPSFDRPALGLIAGVVPGVPVAIISAAMTQVSTSAVFIIFWVPGSVLHLGSCNSRHSTEVAAPVFSHR